MILVLAMAFIFYAIELNWGRTANMKNATWMAATSSASQVASMFASYGERTLQESLLPSDPCENHIEWNNGNILCRQDSLGLFLQILVMIIVIIITIITWGATAWLIVVVVVMFAISMILQYCVIMPMEESMWNKLQQNMSPPDQFRESGVSSGMQQLVTDTVNIPDRFDWNANGKWGFTGNTPNDLTSRYGLYYTERLKLLVPPDN
ncbi:MAG: hypothetical protein WCH62_06030, partial [Candidatus Omnitrophota bacterium]